MKNGTGAELDFLLNLRTNQKIIILSLLSLKYEFFLNKVLIYIIFLCTMLSI